MKEIQGMQQSTKGCEICQLERKDDSYKNDDLDLNASVCAPPEDDQPVGVGENDHSSEKRGNHQQDLGQIQTPSTDKN